MHKDEVIARMLKVLEV